jgi:hypothetical protein
MEILSAKALSYKMTPNIGTISNIFYGSTFKVHLFFPQMK